METSPKGGISGCASHAARRAQTPEEIRAFAAENGGSLTRWCRRLGCIVAATASGNVQEYGPTYGRDVPSDEICGPRPADV